MIERQGRTHKTTHREAKKEKTRGIAKEREGTMETKQLPERARVSLFPLLPLFFFSFVISKRIARLAALASLCAHARNYRPQANTKTKLQQKSTSDLAEHTKLK